MANNPDLQKIRWNDLCHNVLNGIVAIKGVIRQYEVGMLTADNMKDKIETRCRLMEKELERQRKSGR